MRLNRKTFSVLLRAAAAAVQLIPTAPSGEVHEQHKYNMQKSHLVEVDLLQAVNDGRHKLG
jgi:hypothetical protein